MADRVQFALELVEIEQAERDIDRLQDRAGGREGGPTGGAPTRGGTAFGRGRAPGGPSGGGFAVLGGMGRGGLMKLAATIGVAKIAFDTFSPAVKDATETLGRWQRDIQRTLGLDVTGARVDARNRTRGEVAAFAASSYGQVSDRDLARFASFRGELNSMQELGRIRGVRMVDEMQFEESWRRGAARMMHR